MTIQVDGLRWHDPDHASRGASVVGAPSHSYGYGVVAPTHAIARYPDLGGHPPKAGRHPGYPCDSTGGGPLYSPNSLYGEGLSCIGSGSGGPAELRTPDRTTLGLTPV